MKILNRLLIFSFLLFFQILSAGEVTGVGDQIEKILLNNNINIQKLLDTGHSIIGGEVTGVGKEIPVDSIKMYILKNKILYTNEIHSINFNNADSQLDYDYRASEIFSINTFDRIIPQKAIKGLVIHD